MAHSTAEEQDRTEKRGDYLDGIKEKLGALAATADWGRLVADFQTFSNGQRCSSVLGSVIKFGRPSPEFLCAYLRMPLDDVMLELAVLRTIGVCDVDLAGRYSVSASLTSGAE